MTDPYCVLFLTVCFAVSEISGKWNPTFNETDQCECGTYQEVHSRIVGGREAEPNEYPWAVAIFHNGKLHCGGTLISDQYVLTAGHCLNWTNKKHLFVVLGLHDRVLLETAKQGGLISEIQDVIIHKDFSSRHLHDTNDIALIKLEYPVTFSLQVLPVCLPSKGADYTGKIAKVIGWGRISENGDPSRLLKYAQVKVISNEKCKKKKLIGEHIIDSMLCAYESKVDACQGDSGGPLVVETPSGNVEQIGVVSWGMGCAEPEMPGVYTRITSYLEWIALHTMDSVYCKKAV